MIDWPEPGIDSRVIGLGIALALGLLIGLEREWAEDKPIGLRSFGLIALFGALTTVFAERAGPWLTVAAIVTIGILLTFRGRASKRSGITTLVAGLIVFMIGAAAGAGYWLHAAVVAGAVTLILHWKQPMHRVVERLGRDDLETIARFVLITLVVLPLLPNETYGPYAVFNPFEAWLLVVLIVGINLAGYVSFRLTGPRAGLWLAGILGGVVSSTATTFSYAGMARRSEGLGMTAALVVLVASAVVYVRILLEVSIVAPRLLPAILWPCVIFGGMMLLIAGIVFAAGQRRSVTDIPMQPNPAEIRMALSFGVIYVVVLFAVTAAKHLIGDDAVYGVALISGLTDVDALTLSMSQLFNAGDLAYGVAWRTIFLGSLSNLLFKIAVACIAGSKSMRNWMLTSGMPALLAGVAILLFWPDR